MSEPTPSRIRLNVFGESYPWIRIVLGLAGVVVGTLSFHEAYTKGARWGKGPFYYPDESWGGLVGLSVGGLILFWGLLRLVRPKRWLLIDRVARTLTVKLVGRPAHTVAFDQVGTIEVNDYRVLVGRRYRDRSRIAASGLPEHVLFDTAFDTKARKQKALLERLLL